MHPVLPSFSDLRPLKACETNGASLCRLQTGWIVALENAKLHKTWLLLKRQKKNRRAQSNGDITRKGRQQRRRALKQHRAGNHVPPSCHETVCERPKSIFVLHSCKQTRARAHTHKRQIKCKKKIDSSFSVLCTASKPPTTTTKPQYVSKHLAVHPLPDRQHTRMQKSALKHAHFALCLLRKTMQKAPACVKAFYMLQVKLYMDHSGSQKSVQLHVRLRVDR